MTEHPREPAESGEFPLDLGSALDAVTRHAINVSRHLLLARKYDETVTLARRARGESQHEQSEREDHRRGRDTDRHARAAAAAERQSAKEERDAGARARMDLREQLQRFVRRLRQDGIPPERVLVTVKQLGVRAGRAGVSDHDREELDADLVEWTLFAYYGAA